MKNIVIGSVLSFAAASNAQAGSVLGCWDGTFAYNGAKITETDNGVEFTIAGSTLGDLEVDGGDLTLTTSGWSSLKVHALFKAENCNIEANSGICIAQREGRFWPKAYIDFNISDLGDRRNILKPTLVNKLTAKWQENGVVSLELTNSSSTQTLKVDRCNIGSIAPGSYAPVFSERLRDYLSERDG